MSLTKFLSIRGIRGTLWSSCRILGIPIVSAGMWLCMISLSFGHSYSVPEHNKRHVWRIENPDGRQGTGFVLSDSAAGFFLVTNKHVVKSSITGQYFDSVVVYRNTITKSDRVKSTDSSWVLRLRYDSVDLFVEHDDKDVDLVFIQLGIKTIGSKSFKNPEGFDKLVGWTTSMIANTKSLVVNDGARIQLIGYSLALPQTSQYPISRFGYIANYASEKISVSIDGRIWKSEWIIVDASVRGGHSGGPAFTTIKHTNRLLLIGFVKAASKESELTYIIPSHYILELLMKVREM